MAVERTQTQMPEEGRALLTEREREIISGEADDVTDNYRYKAESLVRNRVRRRFADDVDILEWHFREVHQMVVDAVCPEPSQDTPQSDASIEAYKQTIQELKDERDEAVAKRAQAEETQEEYAQRVLDAEDIDRDALDDCVGYLETALDTIPEDTPGRLLVGDAYRTLTAVLNESEDQ